MEYRFPTKEEYRELDELMTYIIDELFNADDKSMIREGIIAYADTWYRIQSNKKDKHMKRSKLHKWYDRVLPVYIPKKRQFKTGLHLAIWNCGLRSQTFKQALKDTRITIRKNHKPIILIKKGDV